MPNVLINLFIYYLFFLRKLNTEDSYNNQYKYIIKRPTFDIDDFAGADLYCFPGILSGVDRFIETNRRSNVPLKLGMVNDVFVMQRLLEHQHVVSVHFFEGLNVCQRVGRIRIAHQPNMGECGSHFADDLQVPAGFDFNLDPVITGLQLHIDLC